MGQRFEHRKYRKIESRIRGLIEKGDLVPGEPVPFIAEMCEEFDCTRQTVSKAYRILAAEGLLEREPGLGWFVV